MILNSENAKFYNYNKVTVSSNSWYKNNGVIYNYEINKTNSDSIDTSDIRGEIINSGNFIQEIVTPALFLLYENAEIYNYGLIENKSDGRMNNHGELFLYEGCNMINTSHFINGSWGYIVNHATQDSSTISNIRNDYGGIIETTVQFANITDYGIYWYRDGDKEVDDAQDECEEAVDQLSAHVQVDVEINVKA